MDYLYRKKRKKRKYKIKSKNKVIDLNLFRQGNIRAGVNILFKPGFIESLEKYGDNIEFYQISDNFGIVFFNNYNLNIIEKLYQMNLLID